MRPDQAPPLHTHSREDESWIILSGRVRFWVGSTSLDECDVHEAEPGAFVWGPRSVPHTYQAITSTAELLCIINPGAIEGHFHAAGAADAPSDAAHSLLEEYGFVIHDNPPPAPRRTDHECRRRSPGLIMATTSSEVELLVPHHAEVHASPRRCPADRSRQVWASLAEQASQACCGYRSPAAYPLEQAAEAFAVFGAGAPGKIAVPCS